MDWLQTLGFLGWIGTATDKSSDTHQTQDVHQTTLSEPVLKWRLDIVPDLENSTSVQYSGVEAHQELLYLGTSNHPGVLMVDRRYGVRVGRLDTEAPVQAKPTIVQRKGTEGSPQSRLFAVDLSGVVYGWTLPSPVEELLVLDGPKLHKPKSDRSAEHTKMWATALNIPVNTPIETDGTHLFVSTNNDVVYALDFDGNIVWRFAHKVSPTRKGNLQLFGAGSPLVEKDSIVVGFSDGAVLRLSKAEGTVVEKVYNGDGRYPDVIAQPTAVQGGLLVSGFEQPSYKQNQEAVIWSQSFGAVQKALKDPFEGNGTLVYHAGSNGVLRKLDTTTGTVLWEWDSKTGAALTSPQWFGKNLLVASHVSGLYLIDSSTGEETWRSRLNHRQTGYMQSPIQTDCALHAVTTKGYLEEYSICIAKNDEQ